MQLQKCTRNGRIITESPGVNKMLIILTTKGIILFPETTKRYKKSYRKYFQKNVVHQLFFFSLKKVIS